MDEARRAQALAAPWAESEKSWVALFGDATARAGVCTWHFSSGGWGALSTRQRAHFERERAAQCNAAAKLRSEWQKLVVEAFEAGHISAESAELSHDARELLRLHARVCAEASRAQASAHERAQARAQARAEARALIEANRIEWAEVTKGCAVHVYSTPGDRPVTSPGRPLYVVRRFAKSVWLSAEPGGGPRKWGSKPIAYSRSEYLFGREPWPEGLEWRPQDLL